MFDDQKFARGKAMLSTTIFYGGKIITVDRAFSIAETVVVQGERIVAVGHAAEPRRPCRAHHDAGLH